ncbi:diaminopimelate decarboxylase [Clostridiales bacterium PH28_bin88]|nr:diaminopimelate decarboxylase [Clostridiales bacterium PH28_bin88]
MKLHGTMRVNGRGHLEIGGCDTVELAREFGTPLYVMDEALIRNTCRQYYESFVERYGKADVIYASKAFLTTAMCRIIEEEGLGLDVVSGGELYTALSARFPASRIYFHGNNKSRHELVMALEAGVGRIMVDNFYELEMLEQLAAGMGKRADVILRISPGIEAHTHDYVKTGQIDSKFGFTLPNGQALEAVRTASKLRHVHLHGIHCHIGSQIFEMESYAHTVRVMMEFINQIREETGLVMEELDLGGGFGIYYTQADSPASVSDYADVVMGTVRQEAESFGLPVPRVIVEPGRSIVGNAGTTLYTVGSIKHIPGVRKYVAVDGGMADNIRPALYGSRYEAIIANKAEWPAEEVVSVTGKCCESGDMLIWDIELPRVTPGDVLAVPCTGAYGYTMSSNYNRLGRPAAVLVHEGAADLILRRETYEDLLRNDVIPDRLRSKKVVSMVSRK